MLWEYAKKFEGKKVGFVGLGVSNTPILEMLLASGGICTVRDMKELRMEEAYASLEKQGVRFDAWEEYFDYDRWLSIFDKCGQIWNTSE